MLLALPALAGVGEVVGELEVVDVRFPGQALQVGQLAADDGDAVDGGLVRPGSDRLELGVGRGIELELDLATVNKWRDIARDTAWKDYGAKTKTAANLLKLASDVAA